VPKSRCLTCRRYIDSRLSRCPECRKGVKGERNRQARVLGPCPQTGLCPYCKQPARSDDPFVWCHHPVRFIDGGKTVVPGHKSCNEGPAKKH
jgi:hypothetical protein